MPYTCDPCECPEQYFRDSQSWRKAMITLLCGIRSFVGGGDGSAGGLVPTIKNTFKAIPASQTDSIIVAAVPGKRIRVLSLIIQCGSTDTTAVFNSKPGGAGAPISMTFTNGANGGAVLNQAAGYWFETLPGESLSLTTGAGSDTNVQLKYAEV